MKNSKIEWTDHTFNPWIGCVKVSAGCAHCYAEAMMDHRYHRAQWGPQGTRVRTSAQMWRQPLRWDAMRWAECADCGWRGEAAEVGQRQGCPRCGGVAIAWTRARVFCASLADVFEERAELAAWRAELVELITRTSNLDWLLLTKRPENVMRLLDEALYRWSPAAGALPGRGNGANAAAWLAVNRHVWIGTSVENQEAAEKRLPVLKSIPARVRFVSCEPLLGAVDLRGCEWLDWVIVGGESGPQARPMSARWARSLRDWAREHRVVFFFKQWGEWAPVEYFSPSALFRQRPVEVDGVMMARVGRGMAGRLLDGERYIECPMSGGSNGD